LKCFQALCLNLDCCLIVFLHRYARWKRTYQAGIFASGVGVHVIDNEVSWAPHQGISGGGNEHLFEGNYLHDLCYEVRDSGAFYVGQSWSQRGNIVQNNIFENVVQLQDTIHGTPIIFGVYLDDQISGWQILNNTFINCMQGQASNCGSVFILPSVFGSLFSQSVEFFLSPTFNIS